MLQVFEFDVAEYLADEAAIEAYVQAAVEGGDPQEIEAARATAARARARLAVDAAGARQLSSSVR